MTGGVPSIDVGRFDDVDSSGASQDFVRWMEHQRRHGADMFIDALQIAPGDAVLDIGCGPGVDLAELHERSAAAVGIDASFAMVTAARRRTGGTAPLVVANGSRLPFNSHSFRAAMCRAVLIHTTHPENVMDEVVRVLQPGARCTFAEPDHGSHVVATSEADVFERIRAHRRSTIRNPAIGRSLPALAIACGLTVTRSWAIPIVFRRFAEARAAGGPFDSAASAAVSDGAITHDEADRYVSSLEALDNAGAFFFAGLAVAVVAQLDR